MAQVFGFRPPRRRLNAAHLFIFRFGLPPISSPPWRNSHPVLLWSASERPRIFALRFGPPDGGVDGSTLAKSTREKLPLYERRRTTWPYLCSPGQDSHRSGRSFPTKTSGLAMEILA